MAKSAFHLINSAGIRIGRHRISRAGLTGTGRGSGIVVHGNPIGRHEISRVNRVDLTGSVRGGRIVVNGSPIGRRGISRAVLTGTALAGGSVVNVSPSLGSQTTADRRQRKILPLLLLAYSLYSSISPSSASRGASFL